MKVLAIVVRYKTAWEDSQTIQSLSGEFCRCPDLKNHISVLIWDNSPAPLDSPQLSFPAEYRASEGNLGVSGAYNRGMERAKSMDCPWLLLLDQDTTLPPGYLQRMLDYSREMQARGPVASVVPILMDGNQVLSPGVLRKLRTKPISASSHGLQDDLVIPFNSGALIRVQDLSEIGGFNEDFWLDYSDYVVYDRLQSRGKKIYVAGDLVIQHKLSILDFDSNVSPQRYANFLYAEGSYWDQYRPAAFGYLHTLRLLVRGVRQFVRFRTKVFSFMTLSYCLKRIYLSRRRRLEEWKKVSDKRSLPSVRHGKVVD